MVHDDGDSDIQEDIEELKTMMFMFGSMFAFTNIPRNLMIISILVSLAGISAITTPLLDVDNSDWEPVKATVGETHVSDAHCTDWVSLFGESCRYSGNFPVVRFSWVIDGQTYYSSNYMTYPPNLSTHGQAERWMETRGMVPGVNITGYVNPDDPSEAVLVRQSWYELLIGTGDILFALGCSTCNVLPILLLLSSRRFEWVIPRGRRKRYKLVYKGQTEGGYTWDIPLEAKELQTEARNIRLKKMSSNLSDEQFEELTSMSEFMDAESRELDPSRDTYVVLLENGQEAQIMGRTEGELLQSISNIEDDCFTVLLTDEREGGKMLKVEHTSQGGYQELVVMRLLNGDELIKEETLDVDKDVALIFSFIRESIRSSSEEGAEWWS